MIDRGAATSERQLPAQILVGPAWIVEVYAILDYAPVRREPSAAALEAAVAWQESRAAQATRRRTKARSALASWMLALGVAALASLAAWWIVR